MATHGDRDRDDGRGRRRGPSSGAVLLAFLMGVAITALVAVALLGVGVATVGDAEEAMEVTESPTPTESPGPTESPRTVSSGPVPQACVDAAEYNQVVIEALDQIAVGLRDQDARTLQEALDAVQDATPGSEEASQECLDLAEEDGSSGSTSTDEPDTTEAGDAEDEEGEPDDDASVEPSPDTTGPTSTPTP